MNTSEERTIDPYLDLVTLLGTRDTTLHCQPIDVMILCGFNPLTGKQKYALEFP